MAKPTRTVPPLPQTERGVFCNFCCDAEGASLVYGNGNNVIWRKLAPLIPGNAPEAPEDIFCWRGHLKRVTSVAVSPNSQWVASGDESGSLRVWGAKGEHVQKNEYRVWAGAVKDVGWSGDSGRLVAAGDGKDVKACALIWDTGSKTGDITGHGSQINSISFRSQRPFRVVSGSEDKQVIFHEGPPFKFKKSHTNHTNFVNCVRFSPDGEWAISVGSDSKLILYSGKEGELVKEFTNPEGMSGSLWFTAWSPDSKRVVTAGGDKHLRTWDVAAGTQICAVQVGKGALEDMPLGVAWPIAGRIVSVCLSGRLVLWDVADDGTAKAVSEIDGTQGALTCIGCIGATGTLVQGGNDGMIAIVPKEGGTRSAKLDKGVVHVLGHSTAFKGAKEAWVVARDDCIHRISEEAENPLAGTPVEVKEFMVGVAWCDEGETKMITATGKNSMICAGSEGVMWKKPGALPRRPTALACKPSGDSGKVAVSVELPEGLVGGVANTNSEIFLFDYASTGSADALQQVAVLDKAHTKEISALRFSSAGDFLASGDVGGKIIVWRLTAEPVKVEIDTWGFHTSRVTCMDWLPGTQKLVSGGLDQHLFVSDLDTTVKRVKLQEAHRGGVAGVVACDSSSFASVGTDGFLLVHKLDSA